MRFEHFEHVSNSWPRCGVSLQFNVKQSAVILPMEPGDPWCQPCYVEGTGADKGRADLLRALLLLLFCCLCFCFSTRRLIHDWLRSSVIVDQERATAIIIRGHPGTVSLNTYISLSLYIYIYMYVYIYTHTYPSIYLSISLSLSISWFCQPPGRGLHSQRAKLPPVALARARLRAHALFNYSMSYHSIVIISLYSIV